MTRTDVVSFSRLRVLIGLIAALAVASTALAQTPTVTWTGTTSGSQNMAATPTLAFTTAGTYTLTTNVAITLTFKGAAGGGGGASGYSALTPTNGGSACSGFGCMFGGGGGGGGAVTTGTSVQLVPGKSYTLVVGAGGSGGLAAFNNNGFTANAGTAGGNTTLTNTTDTITLVRLNGGAAAYYNVSGSGGTVPTGTNAVVGGAGGDGGYPTSNAPRAPGSIGASAANGAAGGGGGGSGDNDGGSITDGGNGGNGINAGGLGAHITEPGTNNGGLAGGGGFAHGYSGGGGGGGGGTTFATVTTGNGTQVVDSFTGANASVAGRSPETNGANAQWQIFGPAEVSLQSNALHAVGTPAAVSGAVVNAGIADATISADWTVGTGTVWGGVVFRYLDAANFIVARYYLGTVGVFRYVAGSWVADGGEVAVSAAAGTTHALAVTTSGAAITVRWDGVTVIQTSDTFQQTRTVHGVIWAPWVDDRSSFDNMTVSGTAPLIAGSYGGGGGGGGGIGTWPEASFGEAASGAGGAGLRGLGVFIFVSACTYTVSPGAITTPAAGATGTIGLTTTSECPWITTSGASWLTVSAGASGSGSGAVTYATSANTSGAARTTALTVGGQTIAFTQAAIAGAPPTLTWSGPTSGSQDMTATPVKAWTTPGSYTVTVNVPMTVTLAGAAAGGGGGGHAGGGIGAGGGGGGGAVTLGTTAQLFPGKTYTVVVGSSGLGTSEAGGDGGGTTVSNTSDAITLVSLGGGRGGFQTSNYYGSGVGGVVSVGANGIAGGTGGTGSAGAYNTAPPSGPIDGTAGGAMTNGAGGGGGGGGRNEWGGYGGAGGTGGNPRAGNGGTGGDGTGQVGHNGSNNGGLAGAGGGGIADNLGGGGGGGGGGALFAGVSGAYGGGGGGAGGGSVGAGGGTGQAGIAVVSFVNGCTYTVSPATVTRVAASGSATVALTSLTDCPWTATSSASWLTVTAGASGSGSNTVTYAASANTSGTVRTATLTVGGQLVTLTQQAIDHVVITPAASSIAFLGSQALTAQAFDVNNSVIPNVAFTWTTSNAAVASVASTGVGTATASSLRTGATTLTASPSQGPSATATVDVTRGSYLVYDNFNFSGYLPGHVPNVSALGDAWRLDSGYSAYTNGSAVVTEGGGGWTLNTVDSGGADIDLRVDWAPASPGAWGGLVFRMTDLSNYYGLTYLEETVYLVQVRQGIATQLARVILGEPEPGQAIHVSVQGVDDRVTVIFNDVTIISVADGFNAAATRHGLLWNSTADPFSSFDNFRVIGALPPAIATLTLSAPATTLFVDYTETVAATALDAGGAAVSGAQVRWFPSNSVVLMKSTTGPLTTTITAREIGTSIITATAPRGPANGASLPITVAACVDPLSSTTQTTLHTGSAASIGVSAPATCTWNARSEVSWVAITGGAGGTGARTVMYTTQPNDSGVTRIGTIFLGGRRLTITQPPMPCSYGIWPQQGNWAGDGGTGAFDLTPSGTCPGWTAYTGEPWIHVTTTNGIGAATVSFTVDPNPNPTSRSGLVGLGNATYSVTQGVAGTTGGGSSGGGACTYAVTPFYLLFGSGGSVQEVSIIAPPGCVASISTEASWISWNATQGAGTWTTVVTVGPNSTSANRVAIIHVGGRDVTIEENASGFDAGFGPLLANFGDWTSHASFVWRVDSDGQIRGYAVPGDGVPREDPPVTPPIGGGGGDPGNPGCEAVAIPGEYSPFRTGCRGGERPPPEGGDDSHQFVSGSNYSMIAVDVIIANEGGNILKAYWPKGNSGVTVCIGYDIGKHSTAELVNLGLSQSLINKLSTYTNLTGPEAKAFLDNNGGLVLEAAECDQLNDKALKQYFTDTATMFNSWSSIGSFANLPWQAQTIIADLWYNMGDLTTKAPVFWGQVTTGNWCGAYQNLKLFTKIDDRLLDRARGDAPYIYDITNGCPP